MLWCEKLEALDKSESINLSPFLDILQEPQVYFICLISLDLTDKSVNFLLTDIVYKCYLYVLKEPLQTLKDRFITLQGSSESSYLLFHLIFSVTY